MGNKKLYSLIILFLIFIFVSGVIVAALFNTDFGKVHASVVYIPDKDKELSALLYRPDSATSDNQLPGIVLVHGIASTKQVISSIALELARCGFITLAIDVYGHGNSEGQLGSNEDLSLGSLAAIRYLETRSYVKNTSIGLVGYSMGAGVIRAAATAHGDISATIFIGGGLQRTMIDTAAAAFGNLSATYIDGSSQSSIDPRYGTLNATFPKNLLIAVGKQDILFNLHRLATEDLLPVFNTTSKIVTNQLYGDFNYQTARKLITPTTTHLLEALDPTIVTETVCWMKQALEGSTNYQLNLTELIYLYREGALIMSLLAFLGLVIPISLFFYELVPAKRIKTQFNEVVLEDNLIHKKRMLIWGLLGVSTYFFLFLGGMFIPIPPLLYGGALAWWLLVVGLMGLFILIMFSPIKRGDLKEIINEESWERVFLLAGGLIIMLHMLASFLEFIFAFDLRIILSLFNEFIPLMRVLMFFSFIPFFLVYFFVEGVYLYKLHNQPKQKKRVNIDTWDLSRLIGYKLAPYIAIIAIQYIPLFVLNIKLFPIPFDFFTELLWAMIPLFIISTFYSWWFYRTTSSIGTGVIFNTLFFAWIWASVFPFCWCF
ncbi:MAG: dienelactone hydrolase family protein [Promethearchaeota archaeon]